MDATTEFSYIGTADVLAGQLSADGSGLLPLGEQASVRLALSGGSKAFARTGSGHRSATHAIDYGRTPTAQIELDVVSKEMLETLLSSASVDASGNLTISTQAQAVVPISLVVIPSRNINRATGAIVDAGDVFWMPFMTDDDEVQMVHNNQRGENANSPVTVNLMGLVGSTYGATALPAGARSFWHGDPEDVVGAGVFRLPPPYQAAL